MTPNGSSSRRMTRRTLLVATLVAASLVGGAVAFAHTHVAETTPGDGEVLKTAPEEVTVRFGEPDLPAPQPAQVQDARLVVLDACGQQVDNKDSQLTIEDSTVVVTSKGTSAGRYEVHWFATASDGAAQSGVFDFSVTEGERCDVAARVDEAKDVDLGVDVTKVQSAAVKGGSLVQINTTKRPSCSDLAAKADSALALEIDTNSDRATDVEGRFVCRSGELKLILNTAKGEKTGSLRAAFTASGTKVKLPRSVLVGHVDVYVQSTLDSDDCANKVCGDRAPDLGFVRVY